MTLHQKWLSLDIWKCDVLLLWGGTIADALPHVQRIATGASAPEGDVRAFTWMYPGAPPCVWVEQLDPPSLAHEFLHIVMPLMYDRGLRSGPSTVEAYCYTLEALMRAALASGQAQDPTRTGSGHVATARRDSAPRRPSSAASKRRPVAARSRSRSARRSAR